MEWNQTESLMEWNGMKLNGILNQWCRCRCGWEAQKWNIKWNGMESNRIFNGMEWNYMEYWINDADAHERHQHGKPLGGLCLASSTVSSAWISLHNVIKCYFHFDSCYLLFFLRLSCRSDDLRTLAAAPKLISFWSKVHKFAFL